MRLAFIKKRFSFHGGVERYLQTLLEDLKKGGHEIHIFASAWPGGSVGEDRTVFHRIKMISGISFISALSFNSNVRKELQKMAPRPESIISFERTTYQDIYRAGEGCHAEWLEIRSTIEPFYKKLFFNISPLHLSLLNIEKKLFAHTGVIIANSEMVKRQIIKHYLVPDRKITVIYNGVNLARFTPENRGCCRDDARKEFGVAAASRLLLFVGSGFKRKGLSTLIEALSIIRNEDIIVLVVGKGDSRIYKDLAKKKGVYDRFVFCGPRNDIERLYAASDLFVLPTLYDPFSNATLEAMASGLPVITTKNNGVSELITNGREGFVVDGMLDGKELAGKIKLALVNPEALGVKARKKAEQFPIEKASVEFMEVIRSAVKKP